MRPRFILGGSGLLMALAFGLAGCQPAADTGTKPAGQAAGTTTATTAEVKGDTAHSDWWCAEHGIPEEECSMCSSKVAKKAKARGDWCDEHDRAKSQCFICDPSLKEKYAAKYRAKYGKEPPPIEEEKPAKK